MHVCMTSAREMGFNISNRRLLEPSPQQAVPDVDLITYSGPHFPPLLIYKRPDWWTFTLVDLSRCPLCHLRSFLFSE